jgi:hypothetical protein
MKKEDEIILKANLEDRPIHVEAIRALFKHPNFPRMMCLNGSIVENPIYDYLEESTIDRIRLDYGPNRSKNFRIMSLDLFLIKGFDKKKQPMLLCYWSGKPKSGWKSFLILFRDSNKEKNVPDRIKNHEKDIETFLQRKPKTVTVTKLPDTKYLVSFKIDQGYKELVAYIFTFCYVNISGDNSDIARKEFEFPAGDYTRKFKWYYPEEMEEDKRMIEVDGDVVRYIHNIFETMLTDVPISIANPIKIFEHEIALSFAGEDRSIAERIALSLRSKGIDVFFDEFYQSALWGKNLSDYFKEKYGKKARYVVPLISKNYVVRDWANFEFSIARDEAKSRKSEFILPLKLDDTRVVGFATTKRFI